MSRRGAYDKQNRLGGGRLLADGQGATKRKPKSRHTHYSQRHLRSFTDLRRRAMKGATT